MSLTLQDYRLLPYTRRSELIVEADGDRYWVAWLEEMSGCMADGETLSEAMSNLDEAFDELIEAMLEWGADIPVPKNPGIKDPVVGTVCPVGSTDYFKVREPTPEEAEKIEAKSMPFRGVVNDTTDDTLRNTLGGVQPEVFDHKMEPVFA